MLLSVMQANAVVLDIEANLATIDAAAQKAAGAGASLLLTPELFPVGYSPLRIRNELSQEELPGIREKLAEIARVHGIGLVYSLPAPAEDGGWYISARLLDAGGHVLLDYAKVHLFGDEERKAFSAARDAPAVVDFNGLNVSLLICYDVEFPEAVRAAAVRGAELLLVPTALSAGYEAVPQVLIRARALESQLHLAYANHSGHEDGCDFLGGSVVAGPDGSLMAAAGESAALLFAEVLADPVRAVREDVPYLGDRRPEVYREWDAPGRRA
ncbi:nitrilase-related carbon-nitrogen hydrolase [Arthrobacter sp. NyZ413]|uniref:nitrilase-related carbon-nitrogen hydrolase n=1 Tax=Arthrobacter sp. NyZ413 TaxID=3144669 RepID=UPI003BF7B203